MCKILKVAPYKSPILGTCWLFRLIRTFSRSNNTLSSNFLLVGISAFFKKKILELKRSNNCSKLSKYLCDLVKIGQKSDEKSRPFSGFLRITRFRLKIAIYKGARLWNLRTKRIYWHSPTLKILRVGGARDLSKRPFFTDFVEMTQIPRG